MTIIGAILLLISVLLLLGAIFGGSDGEVQLDLGIVEISMSVLSVFLVGAASVLLFVCGLELLRSGTRRSLRRRRELKHARAVVAQHERREPSDTQTSEGPADDTATGETRRDEAGTATGERTATTDPATDSAPPDESTRRTESGPSTEPGTTPGSDPDSGPAPGTRDPGRQ
jgi:hypothetical protein